MSCWAYVIVVLSSVSVAVALFSAGKAFRIYLHIESEHPGFNHTMKVLKRGRKSDG